MDVQPENEAVPYDDPLSAAMPVPRPAVLSPVQLLKRPEVFELVDAFKRVSFAAMQQLHVSNACQKRKSSFMREA